MPKQKTIPELKAEIATNERQLVQLQHKQQQFENRITYYEKGDRRKRAHHLITRGAAVERVVLKHIQAVTGYILRHEAHFRTVMEEQLRPESGEQIRIRRKRLERNENRIAELNGCSSEFTRTTPAGG
ncbi:DUF3847 domain-containing protein [Fusibacillus kribbianus]|uniref:DUF3847 domain-containing protein n=1 Tax=Fusibacillus kribbianus TaxID=3044208 RepID=A0AAP4BBM2_9FIRM|nr:DUF3847 domain-containing protein [Ruminococcus sp. YH-rum2234]MDI9242467.1 DUF3847 domain-containing protein [Ruminococcus sp. YH-rum2234]